VAIFIAGVMYILASGSEQAMGAAKSFLAAALKGFAITLGAWFIVAITMWILSAKADLGIEKGNFRWDLTGGRVVYECSTVSSAGQGGSGATQTPANPSSGTTNPPPAPAVPTPMPVYYCWCSNRTLGVYNSVGNRITYNSESDDGSCLSICLSREAKYYDFSVENQQFRPRQWRDTGYTPPEPEPDSGPELPYTPGS
jgi:hypothetical protein